MQRSPWASALLCTCRWLRLWKYRLLMTSQESSRFRSSADWHDLLNKVKAGEAVDFRRLRLDCWRNIEKLRDRPLFVYAVQYPDPPRGAPCSIDLTDIEGFIDLIESNRDESKKVDMLIHSPGGAPEATERIVDLLRGTSMK